MAIPFETIFHPPITCPFGNAFGILAPEIERKNYGEDDVIPCARTISCDGYVKEND